MVKILNYFVNDFLERLNNLNAPSHIQQYSNRVTLILNKFLFCLKTQQNINRLFNRLCTQVKLNLLKLINKAESEKFNNIRDLSWKIIKFGLISKAHSNVYIEFFKNLPSSYSDKSNYQTEAIKNAENMEAIGNNIARITKELFSILLNLDYKLKISIIQFMVNLIWTLGQENSQNDSASKMEVDNEFSKSREFTDLKLNSVANLIGLVDEVNLFNPIDDQNNANIFIEWSKNFIDQVLECKFNLTKFLTEYLKIDHLILEEKLDLILTHLKAEKNLADFLNFYIDCNVKYRQLSRATLRLLDSISKNENLNLPIEFYQHYSECLENYLVDNQTIVNLWKDLIKLLNQSQKDFKIELLKFINCILSRINLCNPSVPAHLKTTAFQLLKDTKNFLLTAISEIDSSNEELIYLLECYYTVGLLNVLIYRFSVEKLGSTAPVLQMNSSNLENFNDFFIELNEKFNLDEKIKNEIKNFGSKKQNLRYLLQLNKLQILNVYRLNLQEITDTDFKKLKKTLLNPIFNLKEDKANEKNWNNVNKFNIEAKIKNEGFYSLVHSKSILLDNIYLIVPLIRNQSELLEQLFEMVIKLIFHFDNQEFKQKLKIDEINLNSIFNDDSLLSPLFNALLKVLIQLEDKTEMETDDSKRPPNFFQKLQEFIQNDFAEKTKIEIFESKKATKYELNSSQISLFLKMADYVPLEFLNPNYAIIYYLLTEKVNINSVELEEKCLKIYHRLMLTNIVQIIPVQKLESWLNELFGLFDKLKLSEKSKEIFDQLLKKSINYMLKENNIDVFSHFILSLIKKTQTSIGNNVTDIINLTLLQTLEKITKNQEFASEKDYEAKLNDLSEKIFEYFLKLDFLKENETFYVCSILIKNISSPRFKKDNSKDKKLDYFKALYERCLKYNKKFMKELKNLRPENSVLEMSSFYVEFVHVLILHSRKLISYHQMDVDRVEFAKLLFNLYLKYDNKQLKLTILNADEIVENTLIKIFVQSINSFDTDDFKRILSFLETEIQENLTNNNQILLKISEFLRFASNDLELNDQLKQDFGEYLQKFLIQTPPILFNLKINNQTDYLLSLLESHCGIISSKYFLLPSHLVISILQIYVSVSYDKLKLSDFVKFQELACKNINVILTRYSKKFSKLADIITNLLMKLICTTTNLSNQNILKNDDIDLAIKAAQDLERVITQLLTFKKDFSKIAPYMISEYVYKANTIPIHLAVKNILTNTLFNLISLCDTHAISQLHVVLANGPKELFKNIFQEYEKYFKYTGKV
ncbi:unnamed protein product [Brachionus calyciflorus]|uniref:Nucleolar 27S pre-rRNA processing Urb2/Npa2 C-terminal domain-containing protein n=1 Tax=Brachionus calyciflorus TaxID=104777 RepID=A0A813RCC6_9BILA|nr:unnamed protein product [Brachionus calyciflorus]